jgi:hypothetical protein
MATPNITLTATLDDLTGAAAGSTANPAKLRITLCGYGLTLPVITGTTTLAKVGPMSVYSTGSPISTQLWGNDQITPANTYYSIEILDGEDNVVQCGAYVFTGTATIDLSNAIQVVPPYGFPVGDLAYLPCTGAVPGTVYVAPGQVVAPAYNGTLMPAGQTFPPTLSYTLGSDQKTITLNFSTELGDRIDAICIV